MISQRMTADHITLIDFANFEREFLENIAFSIRDQFKREVSVKNVHIELSRFYDPARKQYNANKLLKETENLARQDSQKTVGLFRVDIFIPILTFIFGQAFLNGNVAVASLYRLNNERYGMPKDNTLLANRFTKEIIHELGHTYGLKHCYNPGCVMLSSTYVEEIDQKNRDLCHKCRLELGLPG